MPQRAPATDSEPQADDESFLVEVTDDGDELLITADLPGVPKGDLDVSVQKTKLTITADFDEIDDAATYHHRERPKGRVRRVITLPSAVDEKHVDARYRHGVLYVTLPKRTGGKRVQIT
jgi:HSP20 family protein